MRKQIHVLIIEDDFRVAAINKQFVEQIDGYRVVKSVKTGKEAYQYLQMTEVDLILLDIYIPDVEGLDLFWNLRSKYKAVDIVIVSAAAEANIVEDVLRGGIFDYIIKPVDANRFAEMLRRYQERRRFLATKEILNQQEIDDVIQKNTSNFPNAKKRNSELPKGIDPITLQEVTNLLEDKQVKGITAVDLSEQIGTSRSTARRYLEYLVSLKKIKTTLLYGNVGRPERLYVLRETYEQNVTNKN
ncbi:response regulator [Virgibacillus pantothenticus]|uniref:Transcriptional regulator n=1 Tax=Virgibacillus pantothenticus TaxID=1473 RepID=A0A0L0QKG9_VIRPA|nr:MULTISPECIES: response regulator [Virgibacillus]API92995.1 response regulator [Virgibacillus sp. 6R]KNE18773.1 transcriptional regulator [Virgibacillus pantothenticus]MBS7428524.1 response regulator [Virgibacillus sp. 19R1-5]MBU8567180.1 response regulator [Virgibacillus pantothenticus]MBU8600790.1 response regulator [Virgibacillus pantothenticus]